MKILWYMKFKFHWNTGTTTHQLPWPNRQSIRLSLIEKNFYKKRYFLKKKLKINFPKRLKFFVKIASFKSDCKLFQNKLIKLHFFFFYICQILPNILGVEGAILNSESSGLGELYIGNARFVKSRDTTRREAIILALLRLMLLNNVQCVFSADYRVMRYITYLAYRARNLSFSRQFIRENLNWPFGILDDSEFQFFLDLKYTWNKEKRWVSYFCQMVCIGIYLSNNRMWTTLYWRYILHTSIY